MRLVIPLLASTLLYGCAGYISHAQQSYGFNTTSAVSQIDSDTWYIGVESIQNSGADGHDFSFHMPPGRTVEGVEGTVSYSSPCKDGEALGQIFVSTNEPYSTILKNGGATLFVNWGIPLKITDGIAYIHVDSISSCSGGDWEFQGLMRLSN